MVETLNYFTMNEFSDTSKIMIIFAVLSTYINKIKDAEYRQAAKRWINLLNKQASQMWREVVKACRNEGGEPAEELFDDVEAFLYQVLEESFKVPIDKMDEFVEHIKKFNNNLNS